MPTLADFTARGKVIAVNDASVVFAPRDTSYELQLATQGRYDGPVNVLVDAWVRATARKLLTVSSGGAFVSPIFGTPRTIQGRVRYIEAERAIVVQAGMPFTRELPAGDHARDLSNGAIAVGSMVNVIVLPGAMFEMVGVASVGTG